MKVEIARISVGTPSLLGYRRGKEVFSSIKKHDLTARLVTVTPEVLSVTNRLTRG